MDLIYNLGYYFALFLIPFVVYFLLFKKHDGRSVYTGRDWLYLAKLYFAKNAVRRYQEKYRSFSEENFSAPTEQHTTSQTFYGCDQKGNSVALKFTLQCEDVAVLQLCLRVEDGNVFVLPEEHGLRLMKTSKDEWKVNGLSIETLEPYIRLRIVFNGLLRNVSIQHYEKVEFVRFSFIFNSCGAPTHIPRGMHVNLLADALAREMWRDGTWVEYLVDQSWYEQFGVLQGYLKGDSYSEDLILNLPACRTRFRGIDDRFLLKRALKLFISDRYGNLMNIVIKSFKNGCSQMNYGSAILSDNTIVPLKAINLMLKDLSVYKIIPETISMEVQVTGKLFKCVIHLNKAKAALTVSDEVNGFECYTLPAECEVNTNQGRAVVEFWYSRNGDWKFSPNALLQARKVDELPDILVADFKQEEARIIELSGGKGNSLALLASLNSSEFTVPDGFIVTVNAFNQQLRSSALLSKTVQHLDDVCCGRKDGKLEVICNEAVTFFKREKLSSEISTAIIKQLRNVSDTENSIGWAVRSSAVGEDSDELSAAGQNETFLGCLTEEQVLESVSACWASLYSYQSVYYRWQHGVPVVAEMAVVVQRMVPADAAGVLFTCHPFSFNPSQMVVTSNYGLGETVVSGKSDPDTFVLNRTWDDKVCMLDYNIGHKNKVLRMTQSGLEEVDEIEKGEEQWSISEKQAVQLAKLGVALEKAYGTPRDIEWAFCQDRLYLLQSRPITTLSAWTEFDLTHELDYPVRFDYTVLSTGNIGEVMPNAMSVLTESTTQLCTSWASEMNMRKHYDPFGYQYIVRREHRGLIDVVNLIHRNVSENIKTSSTILDLAIFGHPVLDDKLNTICKNVRGITPLSTMLKEFVRMLHLALRNLSTCKEMKEMVFNFKITVSEDQPVMENYKRIERALAKLPYIVKCHTLTSSVSVFYQAVAMNVLLEGRQDLTPAHCADFATILSCCSDVVSAEVPVALEKIAKIIRDEGYNEQFCTIKPEFGAAWLERKCPEAYRLFRQFLDRHGHRSQGEFEVMDESWGDNPSKVICMIQANARYETNPMGRSKTAKDIVKCLVSPKSAVTRTIIKYVIKRIQAAVSVRELTKCELVRAFHIFKQAYRQLSKQMVAQGLLPLPGLIYHLTHHEIGQVIQKRSPLLIAKALKRHKLYPKWNKTHFPELSVGAPVPEQEVGLLEEVPGTICVGTAACAGTVRARACVIRSLEEIDQLQTSDILITVCTDIAWSPYFPMLSGIVTELGGLISHGAVVAREYGLPCIVGVKGATRVFKTGDVVVLSGSTGRVGKAANFLEVL
ncbi:hypothetical protein NQ315_000322 [Exocentrus adspersus]|uniref:Phosphoenolpyruvate synthase n=1 Tax=Exocentrus adspersus TaxID=1586481 RepID=A0AAV8VRQ2_9CUCU|nr:hypothetical protein NQ315_000322 [Exocentrus adspersus]